MIQGSRVRQARELRGQTQTDIARGIGVTQPHIAQIESGLIQPSDDVASGIALMTGLPLGFFQKPLPNDNFALGTLLYRARKAGLTARKQKQAHRYGQVIFEIAAHMANQLSKNPVRIPHLDSGVDPRTAARLTRAALGIVPDEPVSNVMNALERGGVFVFSLPLDAKGRDAFATWAGHELDRPVIATFRGAPGDRLRLSMAHELGHLVMHKSPSGDVESQANQFASEFLIPGEVLQQELTPPVTLTDLVALKPRWGMSIQALAMAARDQQIVSDRQLRYLFQQLSRKGWRTEEPERLNWPVEQPRALSKMAELLYGTPLDFRRLANTLNLSPTFVRSVFDSTADEAEGDAKILSFPS